MNSFLTLEEHLTPKYYVNQAISVIVDESLLKIDPDEKLDEKDFIVLNSSLTSKDYNKMTYKIFC